MSETKRHKKFRSYSRNIRLQEDRRNETFDAIDTESLQEASLESQLAIALGYQPQSNETDDVLLPDDDSHTQAGSSREETDTVYSLVEPLDLEEEFAEAVTHQDETSVVDLITESFGPNPGEDVDMSGDQELNEREKAMLDLLLLCEHAGTPVGFYDKLVSLIKKKTKEGVNMATLRGVACILAKSMWNSFIEQYEFRVSYCKISANCF